MRERWFSPRALWLHLAAVAWIPLCFLAAWWQVTRAMGGNGLSYLYSVEWPLLALTGVWVWWALIHTDPEEVGAKAQRRAEREAAERTGSGGVAVTPARRLDDEDELLAAYNDHLAALAEQDQPKTWRR